MNKFIIGDPHFHHENIIKHCKRPFKNADEMDHVLITNWNNDIKTGDLVYILGDLVFANKPEQVRNLVRQLNGHKVLIYGNHDKILKGSDNLGLQSRSYYQEENIFDGKEWRSLVMFHYPIMSWNRQFHGSWHAYGHCHGSLVSKMNASAPGSWDVGVDNNDFKPISFEDLAKKIKTTYPKQG